MNRNKNNINLDFQLLQKSHFCTHIIRLNLLSPVMCITDVDKLIFQLHFRKCQMIVETCNVNSSSRLSSALIHFSIFVVECRVPARCVLARLMYHKGRVVHIVTTKRCKVWLQSDARCDYKAMQGVTAKRCKVWLQSDEGIGLVARNAQHTFTPNSA